jgi:hypothetical protein
VRNQNLRKLKAVAGKLKKASKAHANQSAVLSKVIKNAKSSKKKGATRKIKKT